MGHGHAGIGVGTAVQYGLSGLVVGLANENAVIGHPRFHNCAMLDLITDRDQRTFRIFCCRCVSVQISEVALPHQESIRQRPDGMAERHDLSAFSGIEEASSHIPKVFVQPRQQLREFGFDEFNVMNTDHG
ncbi:hypothetical protein D3C71_1636470 [compost metagenome]